jgi:hypothetical protein
MTPMTLKTETFLNQRLGLKIDECRRQLVACVEQGAMTDEEANAWLNDKLEQWLGADASLFEAAF